MSLKENTSFDKNFDTTILIEKRYFFTSSKELLTVQIISIFFFQSLGYDYNFCFTITINFP